MTLAPLLATSTAIKLHVAAALAALVLGLVQIAAPKGTLPHRALGYVWVVLMAAVATTSLAIHEIRLIGPFSPIHLLSLYVLMSLPVAVWSARRHDVGVHRKHMLGMFGLGLVGAGLFTLLPSRILGRVVFGG